MKSPKFAIIFVTIYLLIFATLGQVYPNLPLMLSLYSFSPILVFWMVYVVLKYGKPSQETLDGQEWGYESIDRDKLGIF